MPLVPKPRSRCNLYTPCSDGIAAIATTLSLCLKVTWAVFALVWIIGAFTSKRSVRRQPWSSRFVMFAIAALEYLLLFWGARHFGLVYSRFLPDAVIYLWIGLFMTFTGVMFAVWARVTLGRNWSGIVTVVPLSDLIFAWAFAEVPLLTDSGMQII
jgi:hypothetical protein